VKKIITLILILGLLTAGIVWATRAPTFPRPTTGFDTKENGFKVLEWTFYAHKAVTDTSDVFDLAQYSSACWQAHHGWYSATAGDSINYYLKLYLSNDATNFWCYDSTLYYCVDSSKYKMGFTTAGKMNALYGKVIITPKDNGLDSTYHVNVRLKLSQ